MPIDFESFGDVKYFPLFETFQDIGAVKIPGSGRGDLHTRNYVVSGSGQNMWSTADEFGFLCKRTSGDVVLAADIELQNVGTHYHRKACLIIRQSLNADAAYVSAALHGDGLAALQYRESTGESTHDIQSNVRAPRRLRIQKIGDVVTMSVSGPDGLEPSGGSVRICLSGSFYVGLAVCSHDENEIETVKFNNVSLEVPSVSDQTARLFSTLETVSIASTDRRVVSVVDGHIEAPNWTPDGASLIYNGSGRLYRIPASGGEATLIDTGFAIRCNNDHGISPDGQTIVISDQSQEPHQSMIYTLPSSGGTPTRITKNYPSYWHGWSPDGKTLTYCAQREGKFGIFTIPIEGGSETRLTMAEGLDDGPEYSPDGNHIYFNSDRSGLMQIWRMNIDGSNPEQVTFDEANNWFAHVSPDGRWMAYLTYDASVKGHPPEKLVMLRLMSMVDGSITVLAKLFGGQGTINVPSWSPDSSRLAFVSYEYLYE